MLIPKLWTIVQFLIENVLISLLYNIHSNIDFGILHLHQKFKLLENVDKGIIFFFKYKMKLIAQIFTFTCSTRCVCNVLRVCKTLSTEKHWWQIFYWFKRQQNHWSDIFCDIMWQGEEARTRRVWKTWWKLSLHL